jgi:hypothetical protein
MRRNVAVATNMTVNQAHATTTFLPWNTRHKLGRRFMALKMSSEVMEDGMVRGVPFLAPLLGGTVVALFVDTINVAALDIYHLE